MPFKILIEFIDQIMSLTLKRLNISKSEAKKYMKSLAKNQLFRLRTLCIIFVLILAIFSVSLGFSTALYTGIYLFMIPVR
mmetsp:Transcript_29374/g.44357  ORF Transcript_29374/g.44357 Transcript_29374/m.44357 type:complete len:80 (+) Transcript_29374:992-1231(+)